MQKNNYTVTPIVSQSSLTDILINKQGREMLMLTPGGPKRELDIAKAYLADYKQGHLPVLLGSGLGYALNEILNNTDSDIAVVDKESKILAHTKLDQQANKRITWINNQTPGHALTQLTKWQKEHGNLTFAPCTLPFYLRLDRDYYATIQKSLEMNQHFNFWQKAQYPKFQKQEPKILLITSKYFLIGEIIDACERMDISYRLLQITDDEIAHNEFIERLLKIVIEFKPDFAFTINHLGVDREGLLMDLLEQLKLPLASWFVDNPHLILYKYQGLNSPWTSIFTWDVDNIKSLRENGFQHVFYLPLGTTPERFKSPAPFAVPNNWNADVSFVGNSMIYKVAMRMKAAKPCKELLHVYRDLANGFSKHEERSVYAYLSSQHPELLNAYASLESTERQLSFETMITWEATRQYRNSCVKQILPFKPLLVGDKGWKLTFPQKQYSWRWHQEISYYDELPYFYPLSQINFNCTSKQMKGAVNQRVFDVPAAGAFVLTDWRDQMENLFEPGKEIAFYESPEQIPELINFYLANPNARQAIIKAAQKRILNEHTYVHRLQTLIDHMREIYALA